MVAILEDICLDPNTAKCRLLLAVLEQQYNRLKRWEEGISDSYYAIVRKGYYCLKVSCSGSFLTAQQSDNSLFCMTA